MEALTDYTEEKPSISVQEALPRRTTAEEAAAAMGRERCPRCQSTDTKFCYFNNYNTAQPRHFCKSCRRYWTLGGTLRNVPIGGSTRKRLRRAPSQPALSPPAAVLPDAGSLSARARFMEQMGFGMGPGLLWPTSFVNGYMWGIDSGGEDCKPPPPSVASGWWEMAVSLPGGGGVRGVDYRMK